MNLEVKLMKNLYVYPMSIHQLSLTLVKMKKEMLLLNRYPYGLCVLMLVILERRLIWIKCTTQYLQKGLNRGGIFCIINFHVF
ncbi:hypothetical protein VIGAN_08328500 [Vigna angularis var. angularis]|uniref:Uncharacterized protein n=1 Tax=Vigna angularis var. angularis TaxID=157739 RepID=A0A0S3SU42_PHAAN|nr:hypothetical protein VIGAN_08328500 [Vigna angularis var. angularis]